MNNKKKRIVILAVVACMTLGCFCRYEKINKNVARTYEKQEYRIGESIDLDNLKLVVKSYKVVQYNKDDNVDVLLELNIKNTSDKTIDASALVYNSKLATKLGYQDFANMEKPQDMNHLKSLKAKESMNVTLGYSVLARTMNDPKNNGGFQFYIANGLYKNQIVEKYKDLKLYSKYVPLKS